MNSNDSLGLWVTVIDRAEMEGLSAARHGHAAGVRGKKPLSSQKLISCSQKSASL